MSILNQNKITLIFEINSSRNTFQGNLVMEVPVSAKLTQEIIENAKAREILGLMLMESLENSINNKLDSIKNGKE